MTGAPNRHTKSEGLKRLLRRRGRRGKVGANTGEIIKVNVWHGRAQFKPSGTGSVQWIGIVVAGLLSILILFYGGLVLWGIGTLIFADYLSVSEKLFAVPMVTVIFLSPVWGTSLIVWIYARLDGNGKKDRERLIAKADKLRERGLPTDSRSP